MGRLSMDQAREILRQKLDLGHSHRRVAENIGVSVGVISKVAAKAAAAKLDWAKVVDLDDGSLQLALYGPARGRQNRPLPDMVWVHTERRKPGVTLELLHLEYIQQYPSGYGYTQFCEYYRRWKRSLRISMRQVHKAGDKLFVDYSGKRPCYIDRKTGQKVFVELFVAVLGASNFTFAEATRSQKGPEFIASHIRCLEYLGGAPAAIVCDQLRSGVSRPCRYEPEVQRTYEELGRHYGCTVLPARPRKPKDKAKVEAGVLVVQRWILARLRNQRFFSLEELNAAIRLLLEDLNDRKMKGYGGKTRRELFLELDAPALSPLAPRRFRYGEWKRAKPNIDYHIQVDRHFYSVPYQHRHEQLEVRLSADTVEVFLRQKRIAEHRRSHTPFGHTTVAAHMPRSHRGQAEWSPSRFLRWAEKIGPATRGVVEGLLARPHPEQGYRRAMGVLQLAKRHGDQRLEAACQRALRIGASRYRQIAAILRAGLDREEVQQPSRTIARPKVVHENVRGPDYYN